MELARPGYHHLVRGSIATEVEAEMLARSFSTAAARPSPWPVKHCRQFPIADFKARRFAMMRAMLTITGAVTGFIQGVVFFTIVNFTIETPSGLIVSGELLGYPALMFGAAGAMVGAVTVWVLYTRTKMPKVYVSVPGRPARAGDPPYKGLFGLR